MGIVFLECLNKRNVEQVEVTEFLNMLQLLENRDQYRFFIFRIFSELQVEIKIDTPKQIAWNAAMREKLEIP